MTINVTEYTFDNSYDKINDLSDAISWNQEAYNVSKKGIHKYIEKIVTTYVWRKYLWLDFSKFSSNPVPKKVIPTHIKKLTKYFWNELNIQFTIPITHNKCKLVTISLDRISHREILDKRHNRDFKAANKNYNYIIY